MTKYTVNCQFFALLRKIHSKLPIFRDKSVKKFTPAKKIYTSMFVALVTNNRYDLTGHPDCVLNATAAAKYLVFSYRKWNCRYLHKTKTTGWKISTLKHVLRRHTLGESIQIRKKLLEKETGLNNENEYYINRCLMQR